MNQQRTILRTMVRGTYDLQKLRIETGNRLVANFRAKLGLDDNPDDDEGKKVLAEVVKRFNRITDGIADRLTRRRKYDYDGVISNYAELAMIEHYLELLDREKRSFRAMEDALAGIPIYEEFMREVPGCGVAMAAVLISEIDIEKAKYPSSLWKYAGLDVASDGRGRSSRKEHLIDVEYTASDGTQKVRKSLTHNRFLKTKLIGVLAPSFLRAGQGKYRDAYYDYKHRLENHPKHAEKTPGHRHNMALRYAVKLFLMELQVQWRTLEGLTVNRPYHEAKLGIIHGQEEAPKRTARDG